MKIKKIDAYEILDSRGNPTIQVVVWSESGKSAKASVPSGASTGSKEAMELRDGDKRRFGGKGVLQACKNVTEKISVVLKNIEIKDQKAIDSQMNQLDGTEGKTNLGANAILAVSLAVARLAALEEQQSLYQYLAETFDFKIQKEKYPVPMMNVINGGKHSDSGLDVQEFMLVSSGIKKFADRVEAGAEIYQLIAKLLLSDGHRISVGDEGGYAPKFSTNEEALMIIKQAIENSGYKLGKDIFLGIDAAASEFFNQADGYYHFSLENRKFSTDNLLEIYKDWTSKYPFELIEDPMSEFDKTGWQKTLKTLDWLSIIGDDLLVTNPKIIQEAADNHWCNVALIKVNQIGTLSESIEAIKTARKNGMKIAVSHRSGETTDDFIADLAVAVSADYVKFGAPARGERVAKYNRIIEIERELNN